MPTTIAPRPVASPAAVLTHERALKDRKPLLTSAEYRRLLRRETPMYQGGRPRP